MVTIAVPPIDYQLPAIIAELLNNVGQLVTGIPESELRMMSNVYRHVRTGGLYVLLGTGLREYDLVPCAIYQSVKDRRLWIRPETEFHDGRFELIEAANVQG